jgi:type VII secretion-associated serine protease mycosin
MLARRGIRLALATLSAGAATALPAAPAAVASPSAPADAVQDSQQWVLDMLQVPSAWMNAPGEGKGVTVAVIDSGVSPGVSDLNGSVRAGQDLTGLRTKPTDAHWGEHGTWMASIIAGHGHDGGSNGIIGVVPDATILSIRVIPDRDDPHFGTYDGEPEQSIQRSLATGIIDAVRGGARVISMSIGYSAPSGEVRAAVQYAYQHGAVLVASSGNSGQNDQRRDHGFSPVSFPADYPGVIGVGAVNRNGTASGFSSENLSVQVAAPGQAVPAQGRDGLYWTVDGTSPACALVAGVAALIKSKYPKITPAQVTKALTSTASNGTSHGYDVKTGFGVVDAAAAVQAAGRLVAERGPASPVAASAHFGGGPAAVPAPPVPPRGAGTLILFTFLAIASLALALAGGAGLVVRRRTRGTHAGPPGPGRPSRPRYPPAADPGWRPETGYEYRRPPGTGHGAADDRA